MYLLCICLSFVKFHRMELFSTEGPRKPEIICMQLIVRGSVCRGPCYQAVLFNAESNQHSTELPIPRRKSLSADLVSRLYETPKIHWVRFSFLACSSLSFHMIYFSKKEPAHSLCLSVSDKIELKTLLFWNRGLQNNCQLQK